MAADADVMKFLRDDMVIGQPKVGQWFITIVVLCPCGAPTLLVGQVGSRSQCPACGKVFTLTGMPTVSEAGALSVPLGMGIPGPRP